jgi:hypothetical protein
LCILQSGKRLEAAHALQFALGCRSSGFGRCSIMKNLICSGKYRREEWAHFGQLMWCKANERGRTQELAFIDANKT